MVFHDKEHRLLGRDTQQRHQEGVERLPLLLRRGQVRGGIVGSQREGEERGIQRHGLRQRQAILDQMALQCAELLLGDSSRSKCKTTRSNNSISGYKAVLWW